MKHLTHKLFVFVIVLLASAITISAQHQINHSKMDSTKKMHHMMKDSTNHMDHQMMMDSSKMQHMNMDTSKMHHKNMQHNKMKMDDAKQTMNMDNKIWNAYCPVRGEEVDPESPTVQYKGKTIAFCCPGCDDKFKAEPEKYMKNLSEDGQKFIGKK